MNDPQVRIESQERLILELRAKLAEAERRLAQKELYIMRLERRQVRSRPIQRAERVFHG